MARAEEAGARCRRLRDALGLSQAELAAVFGVSPVTVARWEAGTNRPESAHHEGLFGLIDRLGERKADAVGRQIELDLPARGPLFALWRLLSASFVEREPREKERREKERRS